MVNPGGSADQPVEMLPWCRPPRPRGWLLATKAIIDHEFTVSILLIHRESHERKPCSPYISIHFHAFPNNNTNQITRHSRSTPVDPISLSHRGTSNISSRDCPRLRVRSGEFERPHQWDDKMMKRLETDWKQWGNCFIASIASLLVLISISLIIFVNDLLINRPSRGAVATRCVPP